MLATRKVWRSMLLISSIVIGSSVLGLAGENPDTLATATPPPLFSHVGIVIEENHSYYQVVGATNAPYINGLIAAYGLAQNYYANSHPSIPNYFMLTTGRMITHNDGYNKIVKINNVVRVLKANNLAWKAYVENLPSDPTKDSFPYLRHHNPFSYFTDVLTNPVEEANIVDFSQLTNDISTSSLPQFSFIVPNAYHSGHGDSDNTGGLCAKPNDQLAEADCWLRTEIDPLISYLLANNGLLIVTWDEGNGADKTRGGGHVATILVSKASISDFKSSTFFRHQSTLRLMLQALGVRKFPGAAAGAPQMGAFFGP